MKEGFRQHALQSEPHLIILNRTFYMRKMRPLLAKWVLLFLSSSSSVGVVDSFAIEYLLDGRRSSRNVLSKVRRHCSDTSMKMLNLANAWINVFAPHCLSMINRVSYGLLSREQIATFVADGVAVAKNR